MSSSSVTALSPPGTPQRKRKAPTTRKKGAGADPVSAASITGATAATLDPAVRRAQDEARANHLFHAQTITGSAIKSLLECMKPAKFLQFTMECTPQHIVIRSVAKESKTESFVPVEKETTLYADKFQFYHCEPKRILVGGSTEEWQKAFKLSTSGVVSIYIDKTSPNCIDLKFEGDHAGSVISLPIIDMENLPEKTTVVSTDAVAEVSAAVLDGQLKAIKSYSPEVEIQLVDSTIELHYIYKAISKPVTTKINATVTRQTSAPVIAKVPVAKMLSFAKFRKCTANVKMYFGVTGELILEFNAGNLGNVRMIIPSSDSKK